MCAFFYRANEYEWVSNPYNWCAKKIFSSEVSIKRQTKRDLIIQMGMFDWMSDFSFPSNDKQSIVCVLVWRKPVPIKKWTESLNQAGKRTTYAHVLARIIIEDVKKACVCHPVRERSSSKMWLIHFCFESLEYISISFDRGGCAVASAYILNLFALLLLLLLSICVYVFAFFSALILFRCISGGEFCCIV